MSQTETKMTVTILVGLPGSGKSTAAKQLETFGTRVINQDLLGNRTKCLQEAEKWLKFGASVVIDRTNVSVKQRAYWIELAKQYKADVKCVFLVTDVEECVRRVTNRTDHPTIQNFTEEKIRSIIARFKDEFEMPSLDEGFSEIIIRKS